MEVFMTIQPKEARELCSKSEWELVESSFYPLVETLPPSDLKSRLDRARKLYRKCLDLITLQHSDSRKRTTSQKTEMFARAVERFEATLNLVENDQVVESTPKNADNKNLAEETQRRNMDALEARADQEIGNRKSQSLAAQAVYGEQQTRKSGARGVQGHVASAGRRQQGRRDTKNR
jgi:hypothetical protein